MKRSIPAAGWLAALVLTMGPVPAAGQLLRYAGDSGSSRTYVREQRDRVQQTVNGRQLGTEIQSYWRVEATVIASTPDGLTLAIEHDSLAISGSPDAAELDLDALREVPIELEMSRRGEVREVSAPEPLPPVVDRLDLATTYRTFFPRLPGAEAAPGTAWSDTTTVTAHQNGVDLQVLRVDRYASKGWATEGSRRVVQVEYEATLTIEGSGEQQDAEIVLSGSGRATGGYSFDPEAGALVAGGETTEMRMVALVTAQAQSLVIPIVQNRSETITLVEPETAAGQ